MGGDTPHDAPRGEHRGRDDAPRGDGSHGRGSAGASTSPGPPHHPQREWAAIHEQQHAADEAVCRQLRAVAEGLFAEKKRLASESHAAYEQGDGAAAKRLSSESHRKADEAERAQQHAASHIFQFKNARVAPHEVDLHGLFVAEAVAFTELRLGLDASSQPRPHTCVVIYGAGHHSAGGTQKVKPAVLELLHRFGLAVVEDCPNAGCCTVQYEWSKDAAALNTASIKASEARFAMPAPSSEARPAQGVHADSAHPRQGQGQADTSSSSSKGGDAPVAGLEVRVVDSRPKPAPAPAPAPSASTYQTKPAPAADANANCCCTVM